MEVPIDFVDDPRAVDLAPAKFHRSIPIILV